MVSVIVPVALLVAAHALDIGGIRSAQARPAPGAEAARSAAPSAKPPEWTASLRAESACATCPAGKAFEFECRGPAAPFSQRLENETARVRSYAVAGARLVVIGELPGGAGDLLTIIDLETRRTVDELLAYQPAISPGKRYVVFKRHYPRFAPPEEQSDVLLLYDLHRTPAENRVGSTPPPPTRENGGLPLFPNANAVKGVIAPQPGDAYWIYPSYAWADDARLGFLARGGSGYEGAVVTFDASGFEVCSRVVEAREYLESGAGAEGRLSLEHLEVSEGGELRVKLYQAARIKNELRLDVLGRCEHPVSVKKQ